jgi:TPR repeat protein
VAITDKYGIGGERPCEEIRFAPGDHVVKVSFSDWNLKNGLKLYADKDYGSAAGFFRRAAECGHPEAQYRLGKMCVEGAGVAKDIENALKWLRKAADQGHAGARLELGALGPGRDPCGGEARAEDPPAGTPAATVSGAGRAGEPAAVPEGRLEEWYREGLREKDAGNLAGAVVFWKKSSRGISATWTPPTRSPAPMPGPAGSTWRKSTSTWR